MNTNEIIREIKTPQKGFNEKVHIILSSNQNLKIISRSMNKLALAAKNNIADTC